MLQVFSKNKIKIIQKQTAMLLPVCCLSTVTTKQRGFYCQDSQLTKATISIRQDASIMTPCQTLQESE